MWLNDYDLQIQITGQLFLFIILKVLISLSTKLEFSSYIQYNSASITSAVKTVSCILVTHTGTARPNLSQLSWAWFDSTDPGTFGAPADQGQTEITDATGAIEVEVPNSTLTTGQQGTLIVRADDGSAYGAYNLAIA